jgi:hypothetical protein
MVIAITTTLFFLQPDRVVAFHIPKKSNTFLRKQQYKNERSLVVIFSSLGAGGNSDRPNNNNNNGNRNSWDDFLDPNKEEESEQLRKAREYMSDNSLPISFGQEIPKLSKEVEQSTSSDTTTNTSSAITYNNNNRNQFVVGGLTPEAVDNNPYIAVVTKLSPSDLISKFTKSAPPSVLNAVRNTILGLIGGLPKMAFETTTVTTGQKLASLMFQLQMTGYMFKNAEYRLSLQQSLGNNNNNIHYDSQWALTGEVDDSKIDPLQGKVKGKLRIKYNRDFDGDSNNNEETSDRGGKTLEMEVDAAAYMSELRSEVAKLRDELISQKKEKDDSLRKDLLQYIRTLPQKELQSLTSTTSPDVLIAMKGLVNAVMMGIGDGQVGPATVTELTGEAIAQLCMWQLVIGYNLRTLEVREEMRKSLVAADSSNSGNRYHQDDHFPDEMGGVDFSEPGALQ